MHQKTTDSLGFFNLAKGLGMALILWGHSAGVYTVYAAPEWGLFRGAGSVLGGGIMAMFFLISGFGFYKRSPKKCLSIQKKNLLYPYWITGAAVVATKLLLSVFRQRPFGAHGGEYILTYLLGLNAEGGGVMFDLPVESVSILWFLLALFGGWVIYNAIVQQKNRRIQLLLVLCCVTAGWLLTLIAKVWVFCLPIALVTVGYLAVGVWIRRYNLLECSLPLWSRMLMAAVLAVCSAFGEVNIVRGIWRLGLLDVAGSAVCGFVLLRIYTRIMSRNLHSLPVLGLEAAGFYSMWIVCLHAYEKVIFPWYRLGELFPDAPALCTVLCLLLRSLLIYLMYRVLSCIHGRWKSRKKVKIVIE